jgi:diguanylate cyclase (GGDEF)-like protein
VSIQRAGGVLPNHSFLVAVFFVIYGLFTINAGYDHPKIGYVSFDRVSQIASLLVLGPIDAAWVNGLASFIFPWRSLRSGARKDRVLTAALNNSGLMALIILIGGSIYQAVGGEIPLTELQPRSAILLPLLILSLQTLNEALMGIHIKLRHGGWPLHMNLFVVALEGGAGSAGVLTAIVFNRMELTVTVLLLALMAAGMLVLRQFARMRISLEATVAERTQVLREKTVELQRLATRDQLTGLFNRRYVDEYLDTRIDEYHRYGRGFGIALVDLDHFKRINDDWSHEVGDTVLQRVGRIFSDRCRDTDVVARYGGEEFLLCFPEANAATVAAICEQLRHGIYGAQWEDLGSGLRVSLSAGVAEMQAGMDRASLMSVADHKLYEAKRAGRNLVLS